jgi:hypothetical protein
MLFGKKYHILNRGLLAEAISIYSKNINFERTNGIRHINETICLNDVLEIKIPYIHYYYGKYYAHYYSMLVKTYVEGILMAEYDFHLDIDSNSELYREWECEDKEIFHYMPNQFIDLMNDWSKQIVSDFNKERDAANQKKEDSKKRKYEREESVLAKYR